MQIVLLAVLLVSPLQAHAAVECPIPVSKYEHIETVLETAPTCKDAVDLFHACFTTTGADVGRAEMVRSRCERDFAQSLTGAQRHTYKRQLARCAHKYAHESGTMYRAFEAACSVDVVARHSARALQRGRPTRRNPPPRPDFNWLPRSLMN